MLFLYLYVFMQICLESFPISSSGHTALLEKWYFFLYGSLPDSHFLLAVHQRELFSALLHGPTLFILFFFFFKQWVFLMQHMWRCRFIIVKLLCYTTVSTVIALFFYFIIKIQQTPIPLGLGFLITACVALSTRWCKEGNTSLRLSSAVLLGLAQSIALMPGISRLGFTYALARWLGISSKRSFEISFLIQVPLILAAFSKALIVTVRHGTMLQILNLPIVLVMLSATGLAWYGLRVTYTAAQRNYWWYFAVYMIIPIVAWVIIKVEY